jgi:gephyrin
MGELDLLKPVLERNLKATIHFGRVLLKPGKPTTFATIPYAKNDRLVFALPGNPVSALVCFYLFCLPALKRISGVIDCSPKGFKVKVNHDIHLDARPEFYRAVLEIKDGEWYATGTGVQMSSRMSSMVSANGLLVLPPRSENCKMIAKNSEVVAILIK